jgi:hypothetical protein
MKQQASKSLSRFAARAKGLRSGVRWLGFSCGAMAVVCAAVWTLHAGFAGIAPAPVGGEYSQSAAQELDRKLRTLLDPNSARASGYRPLTVSETEANSYLKYRGPEFLPKGVDEPEIHFAGPDKISGAALVDFNQLNQGRANSNTWAAGLLSYILSGKQHVAATTTVTSADGQARVAIDSVSIGGTEVPQVLINFLLQNYVQPRYKIDLNKPIPLPDHVSKIGLESGLATLYRSPDKK